MPFVLARLAMTSPFANVKTPCWGSVASYSGLVSRLLDKRINCTRLTHFMLLAAVIWPNIALSLRIAVYAVSLSSPLSVAVPK